MAQQNYICGSQGHWFPQNRAMKYISDRRANELSNIFPAYSISIASARCRGVFRLKGWSSWATAVAHLSWQRFNFNPFGCHRDEQLFVELSDKRCFDKTTKNWATCHTFAFLFACLTDIWLFLNLGLCWALSQNNGWQRRLNRTRPHWCESNWGLGHLIEQASRHYFALCCSWIVGSWGAW